MMVRTTKQIRDFKAPILEEEWVCLVDLKKQIVDAFKERLAEDYILMEEDIEEVMNEVMCNSSEQKESNMSDSKKSGSGSVSGEHNTGEGKSNLLEIGKGSSPVQNPKDYCEKCGHLLDSHLDEGDFKRCHSIYLAEIDRVLDSVQCKCRIKNVQKKCTCEDRTPMLVNVDTHKRVCCHCGGAL